MSSEEPAESTATGTPIQTASNLPGEGPGSSATSAPIVTALPSTPAIATNSTTGSGGGVVLAAAAGSAGTGSAVPLGSVTPSAKDVVSPGAGDVVTPSAKDVAVPATVSPSQTPAPSATPALPPDLAAVKASDPTAADHIASYCDSATAAAQDRTSVAASCRHEEEAAWKRLVVNNEFPALNEVTRQKCNEAPFPDSYVAKESCAKYQLQAK